MIIIIYSIVDLEPITAIDLPAEQVKVLKEKGALRLLLAGTNKTCTLLKAVLPAPFNTSIYVTSDEEKALLMKASYLPAQLNSLRPESRLGLE